MAGPLFKTSIHGGGGGAAWDDVQDLGGSSIESISRIEVRTGGGVERIATTYRMNGGFEATRAHGGDGGSSTGFELLPNEILIGIQGRSDALVGQLSFTTAVVSGGGDPPSIRSFGPFGGGGGAPFAIWGEIAGFHGRSGASVDAIGCYLRTETAGPFGGGGGNSFQDPGPVPDLGRITRIAIRSGTLVEGIATTYVLPDGSTETFSHGGGGGIEHVIEFAPGEQIVSVEGRSGTFLDSISFHTIDWQKVHRVHGPFGGTGGSPFAVQRKVYGFFGRSGSFIDQLGFFVSWKEQ
ncbi:MAG: hypothetical protein M3177_05790 [Pseudomonadota bacterium]|nr:hypothetical protein [Pseudomonadota bacterium]